MMQSILDLLNDRIAFVSRMIAGVHSVDADGHYEKDQDEREFVSDACLLKLQVSTESFFEAAFEHLVLGYPTISGRKAIKYATPNDAAHAQRMFVGMQRYMDWSTPSSVVKLAKIYFDSGEPFAGVVNAAQSDLDDMKTVRNGTAHLSTTTGAPLASLLKRKTGIAMTAPTAYEVMMSEDPLTGATLFAGYTVVVGAMGSQIANW